MYATNDWTLAYLRKFGGGPFDYTAVVGSGKVGSINQVNHTGCVAVVTPTDRPKTVRNRCVIELFFALFVLSLLRFCQILTMFPPGVHMRISSFKSSSRFNDHRVRSCSSYQIGIQDLITLTNSTSHVCVFC